MEIETRFPMFGGWQTQFYIGYSIPTGDTFFLCLLLLLLFLRLLWLCYWGLDNTCFEFDFLSFPVVVVFCYSVTLDFFSFPIPFLLLSIPFLLAIPFSSFSALLFSLSTLLAWWFTPSFFLTIVHLNMPYSKKFFSSPIYAHMISFHTCISL